MSASDAAIAQGMATRHVRSVKAVVAGVGEVNPLLAKMIKGNRVKWGGHGNEAEWYVRKLKETSSWNTGQLGTRTFEEKDPMDKATTPFCFIDETYGVSEKSIKTNRAGGTDKVYDIQKENARNAQNALYRAFSAMIYSAGTDSLVPVGLEGIVGVPYETSDNITIAAGKSYAGISLTTNGVTAYNASYSSMGWDNEYWFPLAQNVHEIPVKAGTPKWSTDAIADLDWMAETMARTADVSGTGRIIKPDMAIMNTDPWNALRKLLSTSQTTYNVPLGTKDPALASFTTIRVNTLDVVFDEGVPDDSGDLEVVYIFDSRTFYIHTCNTKSEGLIEGQWKQEDPEIVGGVGLYKSNLALICETPQAVGCITGCND